MADRFDLINFGKSVVTTLGGTTANVNIDANTLFVDGTNNRVGIGTTSPGAELEVRDIAGDNDVRINLRPNVSTLSQVGASSTQTFIDSNGDRPFIFYVNSTERMRIDASGRVTKPFQPAFNATIPFTANTALWPDNNVSFVNYGSVHLNRGSHFNASNGRFTAPVAGAYMFCASFAASSGVGTDLNDYQISINDTPSENYSPPTVINYTGSTWEGGTLTVVLNLAVNDFVTVRRTCCNNNKPGAFRMNFIGCLIG